MIGLAVIPHSAHWWLSRGFRFQFDTSDTMQLPGVLLDRHGYRYQGRAGPGSV